MESGATTHQVTDDGRNHFASCRFVSIITNLTPFPAWVCQRPEQPEGGHRKGGDMRLTVSALHTEDTAHGEPEGDPALTGFSL